MNAVDKIDYDFWGLPEIGTTVFRVATTESDYIEAMDVIAANGWPTDYALFHPTIIAERDGDIVGVIGMRFVEGYPLAGPLALLPGARRPILAWKLILQLELALRSKGYSEVIFDVDQGSEMERLVLKACPNMRPFWIHNNVAHYVWNFDNPDQDCAGWAA